MGVLTPSISHFEAPLFRLCAQVKALELKVFYIQPVKEKQIDSDYKQEIDWGSDLLAGYESLQVNSPAALEHAAREWGAEVYLVYGYGWPGAPAHYLLQLVARTTPNPSWHSQLLPGSTSSNHGATFCVRLERLLLRLFDAHHYGGEYSRKVLRDCGEHSEDALFLRPLFGGYYSISSAASESSEYIGRKHQDIRRKKVGHPG